MLHSLISFQARLEITRILRAAGSANLIYTDTDSCLYLERPGNATLPVDKYGRLGSLSSELPKDTFIRTAIVLAAKMYRYSYVHASEPGKIIGETLRTKGTASPP